jgi:hypothetical protein
LDQQNDWKDARRIERSAVFLRADEPSVVIPAKAAMIHTP